VRKKYPKTPILSNGKSDENSKDGHDTQKDYSTALKERNVDENESRRITFENKNILRKKDGNTNKGDVNWSSSPLQTSHNEHPKPPNPPKSKCHEKDEDENQRTPSSNDENQALLNGKNENVTPKYEGDSRLANAFARTPHAAAWISKHMSGDKERFLKVLSGERNGSGSGTRLGITGSSPKDVNDEDIKTSSEVARNMDCEFVDEAEELSVTSPSPSPSSGVSISSPTKIRQGKRFIEHLNMGEYKAAPRVVKMQVSFEEVNRAADAINDWLVEQDIDQQSYISVMESDANDILETIFDKRKGRSILMSFCHFRRMVMQLSSSSSKGKEKHFLIPYKQ
jgi:hypothetical protein